jgi:aspartate aminotransferase-like enzyme
VNTIKVPEGVDWAALVKNAMDKFNLEIAGGLGPTAGKVWRVSSRCLRVAGNQFMSARAAEGWCDAPPAMLAPCC